jgi:hypothetical protein
MDFRVGPLGSGRVDTADALPGDTEGGAGTQPAPTNAVF